MAAAGDLAVVRGTYRFTPDTQEPAASHEGKFIGVWRNLDGDWRLQYNISNASPAPVPAR